MLSEESTYRRVEYMRYRWGRERRLSFPLGSAYILSSGRVRRQKTYEFFRTKSWFDNIIQKNIRYWY